MLGEEIAPDLIGWDLCGRRGGSRQRGRLHGIRGLGGGKVAKRKKHEDACRAEPSRLSRKCHEVLSTERGVPSPASHQRSVFLSARGLEESTKSAYPEMLAPLRGVRGVSGRAGPRLAPLASHHRKGR